MADQSLSFLLENLQQLIKHHSDLISNVKQELESLQKDLTLLQAFVKGITTKKLREDEKLRALINEIRDVVHEAEDVIDTYVTLAAMPKASVIDYFKTGVKKHNIAEVVAELGVKVQKIYNKSRIDFALMKVEDPGSTVEENEAPIIRKVNIVGFEEEETEFVGYLKEEKDHVDVLSIIGMPGLGKSTLAGMIYRHPDIVFHFPTRIWVYVSQEFNRRNVLLAILRALVTSVTDDMANKTDEQLGELVAERLKIGKFLIVMDDVWTAKDWKKLRETLPMSNNNGKILITSRQMEVGNAANGSSRPPHKLRFLTKDESWLLLRLEVFNNREPRTEFKEYGESILKKCDGLPLSIVVIGGILSERVAATDVSGMLTMWKEVSENVNIHIVNEDATKRVENIIALSYDKLPYYLRACFLYLGMFPEDFEIPTWKLTRMWIGEGFIQQKSNGGSLEESAENHLGELINRNLLSVDQMSRNGKVKTCRIHDMIRDFCIFESCNERENFLQDIKMSSEGAFVEILNFRRICIHDNVVNFLSSKLHGPKARSLVCFSGQDITLPTDKNSAIPAAFKLLRVLEVQTIKFSKVPKGIEHLLHLRFVSISLNLGNLPTVFSKLWNIQTLIVNTKNRTLEIKADVWKMIQLRHFKTNASATLPEIAKTSTPETCGIKTLGTISPKSCTKRVFDKACYLKKVGIRGKLAMLLESKNDISFANMAKLVQLEKLKLVNDVHPDSTSNNPLQRLPLVNQFPPNLRRLTLSNTYLQWSEMSVLGQLKKLEVLKLKDNAFVGETWVAVDNEFRELVILFISRTKLVKWIASSNHFPKLRGLELLYCDELTQIPDPEELAKITYFQTLKIHRCAEAFAQKFDQKFAEKFPGKITPFKLSIFPPLK